MKLKVAPPKPLHFTLVNYSIATRIPPGRLCGMEKRKINVDSCIYKTPDFCIYLVWAVSKLDVSKRIIHKSFLLEFADLSKYDLVFKIGSGWPCKAWKSETFMRNRDTVSRFPINFSLFETAATWARTGPFFEPRYDGGHQTCREAAFRVWGVSKSMPSTSWSRTQTSSSEKIHTRIPCEGWHKIVPRAKVCEGSQNRPETLPTKALIKPHSGAWQF